ncbi:MAG: hypothetical protein JST75_09225 [Bacteroidetes bacterium]|nr:hypothetical protein [Bacteroidota bacterium]
MKKINSLLIFGAAFILIASCQKNTSTSKLSTPVSMEITGVTLDSAFQISNPMSFIITFQSSTLSFQTTPYDLPISNSAWYPSGTWQGLKQTFDVTSQITMTVYFKLPGSQELYPEGNYSVFNFRPDDRMGTTPNNSPSTISFMNTAPGVVSTKITLSVIWQ